MTQLNAKPKAEESAPLHVLIIGAGVVGTTLAQALRKVCVSPNSPPVYY